MTDMLEMVEEMAQREGLDNIETMRGDIDEPSGSGLASGTCDAIVLSNTLFQIENKPDLMSEIARVLKPGGRAVVIDWTESYNNLGPHESHIVTRDEAEHLAQGAGLRLDRRFEPGEHHWGIVVSK